MKLHLPKQLLTAMLLVGTISQTAWATTYFVEAGDNDFVHGCYFINETNGSKDTSSNRWREPASNADNRPGVNVLHFTAATTSKDNWKPQVQYSDFAVGGITVDSDTKVAGIENNGSRKFILGSTGVTSSSTVNRNFTFSPNNGMEFRGKQSWTVSDGVTLKFEESNVTNNAVIDLIGGGIVDFSSKTISGSGVINIENGTLQNASLSSGTGFGLGTNAKLNNVTIADDAYYNFTYDKNTTGLQNLSASHNLGTSTNVTIGTINKIRLEGAEFSATSSYENSTLTITSGNKYYNVGTKDTVALGTISGANVVTVNGILTGVNDTTLSTSQPIVGTGTVQIGSVNNADTMTGKLSALGSFAGTVELVDGGKLHFGNTTTHLASANKIKISQGGYITGWGATFNHDIELNGGAIMYNSGTWAGDIHVAADSALEGYQNNGGTISGTLTAEAGTTLSVIQTPHFGNSGGTPTLTFSGTLSKLDGATLDIQHGNVKIQGSVDGNKDAVIAGAIKVGAGTKLQVVGKDALGYDNNGGNYTDSITAKGSSAEKLAKVQLDATQTMSTNLVLEGYTEISGSEFNSFGGKITASNTSNTIKNNLQLRKELTVDVGGSLTLEGNISYYGEDQSGKLIKDGAGVLEIKGSNSSDKGIEVKAGKLLAATGSGIGAGSVTIKGGSVEITDAGNGAKVEVSKSGTSDASFTRNGENGSNEYSVGNVSYSIANADVNVKAAASGTTISNRLIGVALTNSGTGTLSAGNGYNNYTALIAESGNIYLEGYGANADAANGVVQGDIAKLVIGAEKSITAYSGWKNGKTEATIVISGTATFGAGATLNASLEFKDGATLSLDGALKMGSMLTLGSSLVLDTDTLQGIMGLGDGEKYSLFTSVDTLKLGNETYTIGTVLDAESGFDLDSFFTLANTDTASLYTTEIADSGNSYYLGYDANGTVYAGKVASKPSTDPVPEPTTATLSLLALAALAARRRRK